MWERVKEDLNLLVSPHKNDQNSPRSPGNIRNEIQTPALSVNIHRQTCPNATAKYNEQRLGEFESMPW